MVPVTSDKLENAVPWVGVLILTWGFSLTSCLSLAPAFDSEAQLQNRANETALVHSRVDLCVCVNTRLRTANEMLLIQ